MITTKQIAEVRRMIEEEGRTASEVAVLLGVTGYQVYYWAYKLGIPLPPKRWRHDLRAQYGAYDRKTDALVAMGTGPEVAGYLGITVETLRTYVTKGTGKYLIIRMDDDICMEEAAL